MNLTHLSLFSGIGGLDLAAEWAGFKTVGQCEWADYPTKVLEKHWPDVPRWKDIRTLTGGSFYERTGRRTVDIISGGFPCQPFSVAGKRRGKEDDRYLWPEMVRVIKELRPTWVVGENVAGIVRMALPDILSELEACGYRTRAFLIPACAVGARHRRYRVAIVAHANGRESRSADVPESGKEEVTQSGTNSTGKEWPMADTNGPGCSKQHIPGEPDQAEIYRGRDNEGTICNPASEGLPKRAGEPLGGSEPEPESERSDSYVSDSESGREQQYIGIRTETRGSGSDSRRSTESCLGGMADGIPGGLDGDLDFLINHYWEIEPDIPRIACGVEHRADRLKVLGNAVVPQQFYLIFKTIYRIECMIQAGQLKFAQKAERGEIWREIRI